MRGQWPRAVGSGQWAVGGLTSSLALCREELLQMLLPTKNPCGAGPSLHLPVRPASAPARTCRCPQ